MHLHSEAGHECEPVLQSYLRLCAPSHVTDPPVQAHQAVTQHDASADYREHEESDPHS